MQIDLNDLNDFTIENVKKLIASKDDTQHRQLRVSRGGIAYLSNDVGFSNIEDVLFRFETWNIGNSYSGEEASKDDVYIARVYNDLKDNWPTPKASYIDF